MNATKFHESLLNALLELSPDVMIAGVVLALLFSLTTAHLYAFWRKRKPPQDSTSVLSGVMLVPVLVAMILCMGYERYRVDQRQNAQIEAARMSTLMGEPSPRFDGDRPHRAWLEDRGHKPPTQAFFKVADTNNDGQLSPEEAAQFVRSADTDGDGKIDAEVLESTVRNRDDSPPFPPAPPLEEYSRQNVARRPWPVPPPGS